MTQFIGEIKKVEARKTVSLDMVYKIVIETPDASILSLGALPPDITVKVEIKENE